MHRDEPLSVVRVRAQGIETVRRDNCQLVRTVVSTCLDRILIEEDIEGAKEYVRATISDLLMNRLDLSLLVITKASLYLAEQLHIGMEGKTGLNVKKCVEPPHSRSTGYSHLDCNT